MRLWPFRKSRADLERKHSAAGPNIAVSYVGRPVWTPRDYASFSDEAYLRNAIAFRCVKLIASSAAAAPWLLYGRGGKEVEAHAILDLLARPSPITSGASFFEAAYAYYLLAGNSYVEAVGPELGEPKELWALRPDRMQVIPGRFGLPEGYRYTVNGLMKDWQCNPLNGQGQIMHLKDFNPLDDWYGMSRIEAAAYGIDRHNAASAHNKALLDNGARPSGALVFKPVKVSENEYAAAPQSMIDAARDRLQANNVGPAAAGKAMVFSGDVTWEEMGISPKDMDFGEGKDDAARDICTALGVPHVLIVPGQSTFNNVREAKLSLYEDTVLPLLDQFADGLNAWLCPRFGDGLRLAVDEDAIPALEFKRETRRTSVTTLMKEGVIDKDEARAALGYGPRHKDAVQKVDPAVLTALLKAAPEIGIVPLARYMRSVGLVAADATDQQILAAAMDFEDDESADAAAQPDEDADADQE